MSLQSKRDFRNRLFPQTIRHASEISFYRELWRGIDVDRIHSVNDLPRLPTIDKQSHRVALQAESHPRLSAATILHTTGTTDTPFIRYRSQEESDFFSQFVRSLIQKGQSKLSQDPKEPCVVFSTSRRSWHGGSIQAPAAGTVFYVDPFDPNDLALTVQLLTGETILVSATKREARQIVGRPEDLVIITGALLAAGQDPTTTGVRRLTSCGDYLSGPSADFLRQSFQPSVSLVDRYSLSEIIGGATACERCGAFHFDPMVVPEVVDFNRDPVGTGCGLLVLTELVPFSQLLPFIRYVTGDLVEVVSSDCDPGEVSVRFLGRHEYTPTLKASDGLQVLVRGDALRDALERLPAVSRKSVGSTELLRQVGGIKAGPPLAEVTTEQVDGRVDVHVRVAITFAPLLHGERTRRLEERVRRFILRANPPLARAIEGGRARLCVSLVSDVLEVNPLHMRIE